MDELVAGRPEQRKLGGIAIIFVADQVAFLQEKLRMEWRTGYLAPVELVLGEL